MTQTITNFKINMSNRLNTKSSDNTPFLNMRKNSNVVTDNGSIIGKSLMSFENTNNKKPKFLEKFSTFISKDENGKKNLM